MKDYIKYKFYYPIEKFNEIELDNIKTIHNYTTTLNRQKRNVFIKQVDEIANERIMQEILDFYNFLAKAIKHGAEPIELYNATSTNKTISKDMARTALYNLTESFGVDLAYFDIELQTAKEILLTFIEQQ